METFKNRLLEYARARFDMGQSKFEDYCGINRGTISAIKVQGPTASIVMKIAIKCPDLNMNWLFRGTGRMLLNEPTKSIQSSSQSVQMKTSNDVHHNQQVIIANWGDLRDILSDIINQQQEGKK